MSEKTKEELEREVERLREADERWGRNHQLVIEERAEALRRVKELEAEVDRQANLISSYEHNIDCAKAHIARLATLKDENKKLRELVCDGFHVSPDEVDAALAHISAGQEVVPTRQAAALIMSKPVALPAEGKGERVETGPVRIGDDWAGIFIRGDNALHWAFAAAAGAKVLREKDVFGAAALDGLAKTLRSCREPCEAVSLSPAPQPVGEVRDGWAPFGSDAAFTFGQRLTKTKGSSWTGKVVGFYNTSLTPRGYCIESENEPGSVQLYPEAALSASPSPAAQEDGE